MCNQAHVYKREALPRTRYQTQEKQRQGTEKMKNNREMKLDSGKPKLRFVPTQITRDIAQVREYGNKKYGDTDGWRKVELERYIDAAYRHWLAVIDEPYSADAESGIEHDKHCACNIAFICEMMQ